VPEILLEVAVLVDPARVRDSVVTGAVIVLVPLAPLVVPREDLLEFSGSFVTKGEIRYNETHLSCSLLWFCF
jgi:hypothetical protein